MARVTTGITPAGTGVIGIDLGGAFATTGMTTAKRASECCKMPGRNVADVVGLPPRPKPIASLSAIGVR